ncbi:diaminopimelate epimerase [Enterococcus canintestini]|uniref:diaminopimelate epimerase n=1 Tax=Enterococcus canintestini TaxID=317010 RepID=UPI00288DA579|nr:diaminopimelate epimerase [Enterococcus canintestini]MDT2740378.1 diaminopimelate epimerase [Enterococcus canintestini]
MEIPFVKMQGAGNDFIIINNLALNLSKNELSQLAKGACRAHLSLGADALMAVDKAKAGGDFRMRFYNADGTEAEMCGNGARCIARYAYEENLAPAEMKIETMAGMVPAWHLNKTTYKVQLNDVTRFEEKSFAKKTVYYVELGNPAIPHLVMAVSNLAEKDLADLRPLAKQLRNWQELPKGANVNFYEIVEDVVIVRTYERGVEDFTLACGTGSASVAYVVKQRQNQFKNPVALRTLGGKLEVQVQAKQLFLTGGAAWIAKGELSEEALCSDKI